MQLFFLHEYLLSQFSLQPVKESYFDRVIQNIIDMVEIKYNCLNNKTIKKIKNRLLTKNKTIKNMKYIIKNHIEKYLTVDELYSIDCKNEYNDIIKLFDSLSHNHTRECKINKKRLLELNVLKNK